RPSSQARSSGVANATRASAARSTTPSSSTPAPKRERTAATTSGSEYSSCTTRSVESTAAPARSSADSAVDLPAPIPPVSPTNGIRGCSDFRASFGGLVGSGRRGAVPGIRLVRAGEHILGQAELGHVVEVGAVAIGGRLDRADRQHLPLDPLD